MITIININKQYWVDCLLSLRYCYTELHCSKLFRKTHLAYIHERANLASVREHILVNALKVFKSIDTVRT